MLFKVKFKKIVLKNVKQKAVKHQDSVGNVFINQWLFFYFTLLTRINYKQSSIVSKM